MPISWKHFTNNLIENDLQFLDRESISENDLRRIWKDILLHEELAIEYAKKSGELYKAKSEIEKIKKEFHRKIKNKRFYTNWEAEKIIERLKPMKAHINFDKYTTDEILIDVSCGNLPEGVKLKKVHDTCIDKIRTFTGCKLIKEEPIGFVRMKCKIDEREVPVTFFLLFEEKSIKVPFDYNKLPSRSRLIRDSEYYG